MALEVITGPERSIGAFLLVLDPATPPGGEGRSPQCRLRSGVALSRVAEPYSERLQGGTTPFERA